MKLKYVIYIWERLLDKLERRESVSKLTTTDDLILSNASLHELKRGVRIVYGQLHPPTEPSLEYVYTTGEMIDKLRVGQLAMSNEQTFVKRESFAYVWCTEDGVYTPYRYFYLSDETMSLRWNLLVPQA